MNKHFIPLVLIAIFVVFFTSGCSKIKTMILFNKSPITKETVLNNSLEFEKGERIYYLFVTEKPLKTDIIRVELRKRDEKTEFWGVSIVYGNDYKLYKDQIYYFTDYLVLNQAGHYYMLIYSKGNMNKPLATSEFFVKK